MESSSHIGCVGFRLSMPNQDELRERIQYGEVSKWRR